VRLVLANPGGVDTVDYAISVTLDMYFQNYVNKASSRFSSLEHYSETIVVFWKVSSLSERSISNDLTQAIFVQKTTFTK
jgi:hypothetical protein